MARFNFFENCTTLEAVKARFHELCFKLHPDVGGNAADFRAMKAEYEIAFEAAKNFHKDKEGKVYEKTTFETPDDMARIIEALIHIKGLRVELIGSWLWVTGETKANKDFLHDLGLRYASGKKAWFWTPDDKPRFGKLHFSMNDLRREFGVETLADNRDEKKRNNFVVVYK